MGQALTPDSEVMAQAMHANVRRHRWYVAATAASPWLAVFFLYFTEQVGFVGAVNLSAIYYLSVVLLEVPSGYVSDRVGRRATLITASACLMLAYMGFMLAPTFSAFALCQVLLAAGIAFQSGSDSALLHDSLASVDATDRYAEAEARALSLATASASVFALLGGFLGAAALWLPYALAFTTSSASLVLAMRIVEPPVDRERALDLGRQLRVIGSRLRDTTLTWLLLWYVLAFALAHVTFEFYQPWIRLLGESGSALGEALAADARTPILSGAVMAVSMLGGVLGAMVSLRMARHFELPTLLLLANGVQLLIIAGLAVALHPAALMLVFLRNFSMNMTHAPTLAVIAPRIDSSERATWLSVQSLAGRLGFSVILFALSSVLSETVVWSSLSRTLWLCVVSGGIVAVVVALLGRRIHSA